MELIILIAICCYCIAAPLLCYSLGKHKERMDWNRLIEDGILPRPSRK